MYKNLKLKRGDRKIWIGSDFHFDHNKEFLWGARGFSSPEQHRDYILQDLADNLKEDDIFIYLGDFSLNSSLENTLEYLEYFTCKEVYYLWGNHESFIWKVYKQAMEDAFDRTDIEVYPLKYNNITFVGHKVCASIDKKPIVLTHMAQNLWDLMQHGSWNICGHSHGNFPKANLEGKIGKVFDVGVDNALKVTGRSFFEWSELKPIFDTKKVEVVDHHDGTGNG